MPVRLHQLDKNNSEYKFYKKKFDDSWKHLDKSAEVKEIYFANTLDLLSSYRGQRFGSYMASNGGKFRTLFHGTQRACHVGDHGNTLKPCADDDCYLCSILRQSFKMREAVYGGMFGPGIYTTPVSSKADVYAKNYHIRSHLHAMFICRVVCNQPQHLRHAEHNRTCPDHGYDCVEAVTKKNGGDVEYPEVVVYREDAIVPVGVIMYTREGWGG